MTESEFNTAMESAVANIMYLRRELVSTTATNLALMDYIGAIAEKTLEIPPEHTRERILKLRQQHEQAVLEHIERTAPALAAALDTRSSEEVEDGLRDDE